MYYQLIKISLYSLLHGRPVQLGIISDSLGSVNYIILSVLLIHVCKDLFVGVFLGEVSSM